jgi:hypothetical protein
MKIGRILVAGAAAASAAVLLLPSRSDAYALLGTSLSTSLRHFRVYDNFTDASAHDNTVPDTNFPGYQGVTMAAWKAAIEWGSQLHGNGNGDASQPGGLGSGGANFDPYFQGNATTVGNIGDNTISELAGSSGGVLAFTESLGNNTGWRMRMFSTWIWADGPGTNIPNNQIDMQGVICHEYGHALGLDHSTDPASTMVPAIVGTGVSQRSIATDDQNGVRAIYGVAAATKPIITSILATPGSVTIFGSNFGFSGNQVWFTKNAAGPTTSVIVSNVTSTGTQLTVAVPANAGPGDVLVKTSASGGASLSNAWPFTPNTGPLCPSPYNFCFTSPNTFDPNGSYMGWAGSQFVSNNDFVLIASSVPPNAAGLFFMGLNETFSTFGNGFRCVGGSVARFSVIHANTFGDAVQNVDMTVSPALGRIVAGSTWKFQFWYRNPLAGGAGFNLSDGLSVDFCP